MGIIIKKLKFNTDLEANNALDWVNYEMGFPTNFEDKQNTLTWDNVVSDNGFFYFIEPPITHSYTVVEIELPQTNLFG